jgi:hypothetical protein
VLLRPLTWDSVKNAHTQIHKHTVFQTGLKILEEDDDENGASVGDTKKSSAFSRNLKLQIVRLVYMLGDEDEVRVGGLLTFFERA